MTIVVLGCNYYGEFDFEAQWNVRYAGGSISAAQRAATVDRDPDSYEQTDIDVQVWFAGERINRP